MTGVTKKCPKCGVSYAVAFTGVCESCFTPLQFYCPVHGEWLVDGTCSRCTPKSGSPAAPTPGAPGGGPPASPFPDDRPSVFGPLAVVAVLVCLAAILAFALYKGLSLLLAPRAPVPASTVAKTPAAPPVPSPVRAPPSTPAAPPATPKPTPVATAASTPAARPAPTPVRAPASTPVAPYTTPKPTPVATSAATAASTPVAAPTIPKPTPAAVPVLVGVPASASPRPAPALASPERPAVDRTVSEILLGGEGGIGELVRVSGTLQAPGPGRDSFDLHQGAYTMEVRYSRLPATDKARVGGKAPGSTVIVTGIVARDPVLEGYYLDAVRIAAP